MKSLNRFLALSAVYFGLASAAGAQSVPPAAPDQSVTAAKTEARQQEFQHPMLEQRSSTDLSRESDEPRIQRRGAPDSHRDGEIRRNVVPGAPDAAGAAPHSHTAPSSDTPAAPGSPGGS